MKIYKNILKQKKGFTLTELCVALGVSAIVILIVYTILLTAQQSFMQLYNASRTSDNIRFFENSLREAVSYAKTLTINTTANSTTNPFLKIVRYRANSAGTVSEITEKYYFSNTAAIYSGNSTNALNLTNLQSAATSTNNYTLYKNDGTVTTLVLSNIKRVYYYLYTNTNNTNGAFKKLHIGIIYDEVLNNGKTDIRRPRRKIFCFTSKGYY